MKNFILIDFLIERVKNLFVKIEKNEIEIKTHTHEEFYKKEEIDVMNNISQNPNKLNFDYRLKEGNNGVIGGPYEIESGCALEVPVGSVLTIV
jgi:hypothetical protein